MRKNCSILVIALLLFGPSAYADETNICNELAHAGLVDTRDVSISSESSGSDFDYVCSSSVNRVARATEKTSGGGISYAGFGLDLNQGNSDSERSEAINKTCSEGKSAYLQKFESSDAVSTGRYVVEMVSHCLDVLAATKNEVILGFTTPSVSSDASFTMTFAYHPGEDIKRIYRLAGINADPAAGIKCTQSIGTTQKGVDDGIILERQTSVICTKQPGVSANGVIAFVSKDGGSTTERDVKFEVRSPEGEELIRQALKTQFESEIASLHGDVLSAEARIGGKMPRVKSVEATFSDVVQTGHEARATVKCPVEAPFALSGGYDLNTERELLVISSKPVQDSKQWEIKFLNTGDTAPMNVHVIAACSDLKAR